MTSGSHFEHQIHACHLGSKFRPNMPDTSTLEAAAKDVLDVGTKDLMDSNFKSYLNNALETLNKKDKEDLLKAENVKKTKSCPVGQDHA